MAIRANSTPAPERHLLRDAAAPGRLLLAGATAVRQADLPAILDAGPIDPAALASMSATRRRRAQAGIDALIDYLDAVTPDADLEPSLGSSNPVPPRAREPGYRVPGEVRCPMPDHLAFAQGLSDDREEQDEDNDPLDYGEEDTSDHEPSLGAPEHDMHCRWGWGDVIDKKCDQTRWAAGESDDRELGDDNGLADMDGLCEQVRAYDGRLLWSNGGYVA